MGIDRLLNAIRMLPPDSLMTFAELDVWGGPAKMAEDYAVVFASTPAPLNGFDYARLLLDAKREVRRMLEAGPNWKPVPRGRCGKRRRGGFSNSRCSPKQT